MLENFVQSLPNFHILYLPNRMHKLSSFTNPIYNKGGPTVRKLNYLLLFGLFFLLLPSAQYAAPSEEIQSLIVEVEGDPNQHKEYLETYHPFVEVVAVYDTLFNGLALQAKPKNLEKMASLEFIKKIHEVQRYKTLPFSEANDNHPGRAAQTVPFDLNNTTYSGKGVKVAVIDTGIDYNHPDLKVNYQSGYDLVDLDEDPMETLPEEGIPTSHGTHVAGIIAANGEIKGVAPDAEIYAYRALGPGGAGTSVQVIAALERAIEDEVDVINLSLGNNVNVPDYPTSLAVNRASEMGIPVVIANGNSGPGNWTVGSPATATKALSVGASTLPANIPILTDSFEKKKIELQKMDGAPDWDLSRSHEVVDAANPNVSVNGKIALVERGKIPFYKLAKKAEEDGAAAVVIYNNKEGPFQGSVASKENPLQIPVAAISREEGKWLKQATKEKKYFIETNYMKQDVMVAPFSSRGPVTLNWHIKPDVLAPGTQIKSTVPGGYQQMNGTSMAAPHVTGVVALLKEAHPDWSREQIIGAIKTTSERMMKETGVDPTVQGMGLIQPKEAIEAETIIYNPQLNFGKVDRYREEHSVEMTIENMTNKTKQYTFDIPKKQNGVNWKLPQTFSLEPKEKISLEIQLEITTARLDEGVHQGWITLKEGNKEYYLPYIFVNKEADQPKTAGFEFALKHFSKDTYAYQIYLTEPAKEMKVDLYNPDTLLFERQLLKVGKLQPGLHKGELNKRKVGKPGYYMAIITVQLEDGSFQSNHSMIYLE